MMTPRILTGNAISLIAAGFLFAGCCTKDRDRTFLYQIFEALLLCLANVFFGSWAGISTLLLSALRNFLVMKHRYTQKLMWVFVALVIGIGLAINNRGFVGLLAIAATVELSIANYYAVRLITIKIFLLINTIMWLLYDLCILDISSTAAQVITCIGIIITLVQLHKQEPDESLRIKEEGKR